MERIRHREETRIERLTRRDKDIKAEYDKMRKKKFQDVRMYSHESIVAQLAYQFYLSRNSINNVLNGYNNYQKRNKQ